MRTNDKKPLGGSSSSTASIAGKKTVNIVHILDSSGSMGSTKGSKYGVAVEAMKKELAEFKASGDTNFTYSLVEFSSNVSTHFYKQADIKVVEAKLKTLRNYGGATALNDAIAQTLKKLLADTFSSDEAVIVSILTDGGENDSNEYRGAPHLVAKIIQEAKQAGIAVTFIGDAGDVRRSIGLYSLDESNTLVYDNTAAGLEKAVKFRTAATLQYSKSFAAGASADMLSTAFFVEQK